MNKIVKLLLHSIALLGVFYLLVIPANKYSWMKGMDPTVVIEDSSGNREILAFIVMAIICLIELIVFKLSQSNKEKIISFIFFVTTILLWAFKYTF